MDSKPEGDDLAELEQIREIPSTAPNSEQSLPNSVISVASASPKKGKKEPGAKKAKPLPKLILCTHSVRYVVTKKVCRDLGYKFVEDETGDWDLFWSDVGLQGERIQKMRPHQRINHYQGMYTLARKNYLGRNLMRMYKVFHKEFNFFPKTWVLPSENNDFKSQFNKKKTKTFIIKPVANCQGKGIYLTRSFEDVDLSSGEQFVAQRYLHKPYLIDGLKFDLRVYVLVYGVDPLRVFVFQEGLARFATEEYVGPQKNNLDNLFMHLTNYAINKNSDNFYFNETNEDNDTGHKRSLTAVLELIAKTEPTCDTKALWTEIQDIVAKTLITVQPSLQHAYRSAQPDDLQNSICFEVLGFDIILDHKLKPYLLEVNHSPSFNTDTPLDKKVKYDLIRDTLVMLNLSSKRKKKLKNEQASAQARRNLGEKALAKADREIIKRRNQEERDVFDQANLGNYRQVYPELEDSVNTFYRPRGSNLTPSQEKAKRYEDFLDASIKLWQEFTTGVKFPAQSIQGKGEAKAPATQGALGSSSAVNRAKTDPNTTKAKAAGLSNALNGTSSQIKLGQTSTAQTKTSQERVFIKRGAIQNSGKQISGENMYLQEAITEANLGDMQAQNFNSLMRKTTSSDMYQSRSHNSSAIGASTTMPSQHGIDSQEINVCQTLTSNGTNSISSYGPAQQPHSATLQGSMNRAQPTGSELMTMHNQQQMMAGQNLLKAIQKRFPMVRLEQTPLIQQHSHYVMNQQMSPAARQSKPMMINAFNVAEVSRSQRPPGCKSEVRSQQHQQHTQSLYTQQNQGFYDYMQPAVNHNAIASIERYNMLKHMEVIKRGNNNPQLNMIKQKMSQKTGNNNNNNSLSYHLQYQNDYSRKQPKLHQQVQSQSYPDQSAVQNGSSIRNSSNLNAVQVDWNPLSQNTNGVPSMNSGISSFRAVYGHRLKEGNIPRDKADPSQPNYVSTLGTQATANQARKAKN